MHHLALLEAITQRLFFLFQNYNNQRCLLLQYIKVCFILLQLTATDLDEGSNGNVSYSLFSGNSNGEFQADPITGEIKVAKRLDREKKNSFSLIVQAKDGEFNYKIQLLKQHCLILHTFIKCPVLRNNNFKPGPVSSCIDV